MSEQSHIAVEEEIGVNLIKGVTGFKLSFAKVLANTKVLSRCDSAY